MTDQTSLNAIMDSLVDGTDVVVYDSTGRKRLAIGKVTHCYKNGFKVEGIIDEIVAIRSKVFLYKYADVVCPAK